MAWAATHTFAVGEVLSAANMNLIQANINDLDRRTTATTALVATAESTSSTSYVNLTTTGPAVTVTIGSTGLALVDAYAALQNNTAGQLGAMSFAVSGASTVAASNPYSITVSSAVGGNSMRIGAGWVLPALTAGSNTFTAKYAASANTMTATDRKLTVTPLGS